MTKKSISNYNHKISEEKWQKIWQDQQTFKFDEDSKLKKYYILEMFPYPSGKIHMGHLRNYAIGDALARFKKFQGYNILHPMGFDSFGLPAENAALEHNIHPKEWTLNNIKIMRSGLKSIGLAIDWQREIITCLPEYFKHEQKIFIDLYNANLAYQKESEVNWDPVDKTVLANEQVIDGKGWRSGATIEKKKLKQWFLRVSQFSDELLSELKNLTGWDNRVLSMQEKWIGKSQGLEIDFAIENSDKKIKIYTTRADTIFGASFIAISASHPLSIEIAQNNINAKKFIKNCKNYQENSNDQEKIGFNTNLFAINPVKNSQKLPIFIANFILMDYGCGAVFGCPAHDERDYEFAKKYNLNILQVIESKNNENIPFSTPGTLINSEILNGLSTNQAKEKVFEILSNLSLANKKTNFKLRDWGISRQRYWGTPIPILYLEDGRIVPQKIDSLPITLPDDPKFNQNGNPLANHHDWKYTTYEENGKIIKAIKETDTFDTFFESSWYFLRFIDPKNSKAAFDSKKVNKFMPVDQYIGGIEHAVLHLLYARFFTKALKKCGYIDFDEPFKNLLTQGMVCHQTFKTQNNKYIYPSEVIKKEDNNYYHITTNEKIIVGRSEKMSKSKKNIIEPADIIDSYGADTARLFMLSDSPVSRDLEWSDSSIKGCWVYINRLWRLFNEFSQNCKISIKEQDINYTDIKDKNHQEVYRLTHKTIYLVEKEYQNMSFNVVIAKIREFSNALEKFTYNDQISNQIMFFALKNLAILISPITPHLAEELWQNLGHDSLISTQQYPKYNKDLIIDNEVNIAIQINGKLRDVIVIAKDSDKKEIEKLALSSKNIIKFTKDKIIKKTIIIPNKLVNIVIAQ